MNYPALLSDYKQFIIAIIPIVILSLLGSLSIMVTYCSNPHLRKHPYTLIFRMSLFDFAAEIVFIIQITISMIVLYEPTFTAEEAVGLVMIAFLVTQVIAEFFLFTSLCFLFLLSINLAISVARPFTDVGAIFQRYFKLIYLLSGVYSALRLYACLKFNNSLLIYDWGYAIPVFIVFITGIVSVTFSVRSAEKLPEAAKKSKSRIIFQMRLFIAVFSVCWVGPSICRILQTQQIIEQFNIIAVATLLSGYTTGFFNALIWLTTPTMRKTIKKGLCCIAKDEKEIFIKKEVTDDITQMNLVFKKNLLVALLFGMQIVFKDSSPQKELQETNEPRFIKTSTSDLPAPQLDAESGLYELRDVDFGELANYCLSCVDSEQIHYMDKDIFVSAFEIESLAPRVFYNIRHMRGFKLEHLIEQLNPLEVLKNALANNNFASGGRSGSIFVFSPDESFIIKTIHNSEFDVLTRLLPSYYKHIEQYPDSLIVRIIGAYKISVHQSTLNILVMENIFQNYKCDVEEIYDLKGSYIDRWGDDEVKKDCDLDESFTLGQLQAERLKKQLTLDTELLRDNNIMDYSLLLGVKHKESQEENEIENFFMEIPEESNMKREMISPPTLGHFVTPNSSIVLGIIDILQEWDFTKKSERVLKIIFACKEGYGISSIEPERYCTRFKNFMSLHFIE